MPIVKESYSLVFVCFIECRYNSLHSFNLKIMCDMIHTKILISRKNDPPLDELKDITYVQGELANFIILEGRMSSGKTSIMMHIKSEAGLDVIVQTSAAIFDGLYHAVLGAEQRFKENPE